MYNAYNRSPWAVTMKPERNSPLLRSLTELDTLYKLMSRQSEQPPTPAQIIAFYREHTPHPPPGSPSSEDRNDG